LSQIYALLEIANNISSAELFLWIIFYDFYCENNFKILLVFCCIFCRFFE